MTKDEAKAEAEKIIQEIIPIINPDFGKMIRKVDYETARKLAILQVKGILSLHALDIGKGMMLSGCRKDSLHWKSILAELKRK